MTTANSNPVVLPESDFFVLRRLASSQQNAPDDEMSLLHEIGRAIIVKDHAFPQNTIRINSAVKVQNLESDVVTEFTIVLPERANIRQKKVSVTTPMGAALIGFREGDNISWRMPSGMRHFKVLEVVNPKSQDEPETE